MIIENKQFELEQGIMNCWSICDELNLISKYVMESESLNRDKLANILIGMAELYQMKFENCFENFEQTLQYFHAKMRGLDEKYFENIEDRHVLK